MTADGTILLTGATGFVGSATRRALAERGARLRLLVHRRPVPQGAAGAGVTVVRGDVTDPASLREVCAGVGTVLHLASYIGEDARRSAAVNAAGTRALVAQARRAGVRRFVLLSTAAVYGLGPHRGATESELRPDPVSVTSRSRLAAEEAVLAAGGVVLRPHFVYGEGDRWFVPGVAALLRRSPVWPAGGRARLSVVSVADLATVVADLATGPWQDGGGEVFHVCEPEPVRLREVGERVGGALGIAVPRWGLPLWLVRRLARATPADAQRLARVATDHWYDSSRIWQRVGHGPRYAFRERFAADAAWYRAGAAGGAEPSAAAAAEPDPGR